MRFWPVTLLILGGIAFMVATTYVAPRCEPGQGGNYLGGMLMNGCPHKAETR